MQNRIILCRHAESLEDIDNSIYDTIPDLDIPLTQNGITQAKDLANKLINLLEHTKNVKFITSPGLRNIQTMEYIVPVLPPTLNYTVEIEPLIVKQNWGYITAMNRPIIENERYKIGVLRYKFPTGESAADLINRLSLFRDKTVALQKEQSCDIVILSHGFEFRVLLMVILGWSENYFETFGNLNNCEYRIVTKKTEEEYILNEPLKTHGLPVSRLKGNNIDKESYT